MGPVGDFSEKQNSPRLEHTLRTQKITGGQDGAGIRNEAGMHFWAVF